MCADARLRRLQRCGCCQQADQNTSDYNTCHPLKRREVYRIAIQCYHQANRKGWENIENCGDTQGEFEENSVGNLIGLPDGGEDFGIGSMFQLITRTASKEISYGCFFPYASDYQGHDAIRGMLQFTTIRPQNFANQWRLAH